MITGEFVFFIGICLFVSVLIAFALGTITGYTEGHSKGYYKGRDAASREKVYHVIKREIITYSDSVEETEE